MKILYICHRFPYPPTRGGKIFPFNVIRYLTASGHKVTVCSMVRSQAEADEAGGIAPFCERYVMARVGGLGQTLRMVARLPTLEPSSMGYFYSPELDREIQILLKEQTWDLIFVHCSSVAQYVAHVKDVPKILDFCDMDSQKWLVYSRFKPFPLSLGYWLEGTKLEREEKRLARCFDLCMVTTRAELETLESYDTGVATDWVPHGVDADYFQPAAPDQGYEPDTICFVGRMDYYPNQECMFEFCAKVLPKLRAVRPAVKLLIIGAEPSPKVKALGNLPGVTVTGSVPDVRPYVLGSALMVAPLSIARGTQNKILEAMAMGMPVVSSRLAAGGVDAVDGEHFLIASTPEDYVQAILRILDQPAERARLSRNARERVLSAHSWANSMRRLDGIVERCLSTSRQSRFSQKTKATS